MKRPVLLALIRFMRKTKTEKIEFYVPRFLSCDDNINYNSILLLRDMNK